MSCLFSFSPGLGLKVGLLIVFYHSACCSLNFGLGAFLLYPIFCNKLHHSKKNPLFYSSIFYVDFNIHLMEYGCSKVCLHTFMNS